jgi:hypothetical protein
MIEPAVYRKKKTRNATFAMRVGDGRSGILNPPALRARSVTDSSIVHTERPGIVTVNMTTQRSSRSAEDSSSEVLHVTQGVVREELEVAAETSADLLRISAGPRVRGLVCCRRRGTPG